MSKLTPVEFVPYSRFSTGDERDAGAFAQALLHHWNSNPHHYQYWIDRPDHSEHYRQVFQASGTIQDGAFEMPETYAREMVADWMAATRAHTGSWDMSYWLKENLPRMKLHPRTRQYVISLLQQLGCDQAAKWYRQVVLQSD